MINAGGERAPSQVPFHQCSRSVLEFESEEETEHENTATTIGLCVSEPFCHTFPLSHAF